MMMITDNDEITKQIAVLDAQLHTLNDNQTKVLSLLAEIDRVVLAHDQLWQQCYTQQIELFAQKLRDEFSLTVTPADRQAFSDDTPSALAAKRENLIKAGIASGKLTTAFGVLARDILLQVLGRALKRPDEYKPIFKSLDFVLQEADNALQKIDDQAQHQYHEIAEKISNLTNAATKLQDSAHPYAVYHTQDDGQYEMGDSKSPLAPAR